MKPATSMSYFVLLKVSCSELSGWMEPNPSSTPTRPNMREGLYKRKNMNSNLLNSHEYEMEKRGRQHSASTPQG